MMRFVFKLMDRVCIQMMQSTLSEQAGEAGAMRQSESQVRLFADFRLCFLLHFRLSFE